jgi:transcriptional regulator with XRE-family HTH domain
MCRRIILQTNENNRNIVFSNDDLWHSRHVNHPGEVTKKWRKDAKLSIPRLAKSAGIDKGTISRFERGGDFRRRIFEAICKALGKTTSEAYAVLGSEVPKILTEEVTLEEHAELYRKFREVVEKSESIRKCLAAAIDAAYEELKGKRV